MRKILKVSIFILLLFFMAGCEFLPSGNNGKNYKKSFELAEEVGYTGSYDDWKILMSKYRDEDIIDVFIEDNNIFIVLDDGKNIKIGVDEDWIDISGGHEKPDEPENPGTEEPGNRPEEPVEIFYNITFDTGCDIVVPDQKVKNLSKITEPELPERDGYELEGWYYNDQKWSFVGYVVTEDMELVAKWTKTELSIRLLYNTIYGYCDVNSIKGKTGEIVELPDVTPNPGYQFLGWEDSKTGSVYSKYYNCGNDNISLVALFGYQVLLISDTVETVIDLNINDTFTLPEGNISNGKKCIGWYDSTNNKIYKVGDTLSNKKPITLTALFEYNMIFETVDNGTVKKAMDGGYLDLFGTEIKESFNKYGENFIGWFDGKYSFVEITEYPFSFNGEDVILYEYKIKDNSFTITFDSNGGDDVSPIQFSSKFESFVDELLNTFNNSANGSLYVTIKNFKETAYYLFDDVFCVKENLKKYSWLFELIKNDIVSSNDYDALNEYDKASYDIIINDLERLIANARKTYEIDFYYYDFETKNAICDYIYGILNKCLIIGYNFINRDYSKKENFDIFMSIVQTNEHINSFKNLPIPVKARHTFTGWYDVNGNLVEEVFDDITLIAGWEEMLLDVSIGEANGANIFVTNFVDDLFAGDTVFTTNGTTLTVGVDLFSSLDAAISMAGDNSIIYVGPGEYSLMYDIVKNVTIIGPNVDLGYSEFNGEEAIINVNYIDTGIFLNCENIVFNGLHLKGFGGGAGVSGRMFRDGENLSSLTVKSCVISDANSVFVLQTATTPYTVLIEDCYFYNIGQFILWVTNGMTKADVKDCYIKGSSCGAIVNTNATLFRIRHGSLNAENNVLYGDPIDIGGYFESNFEYSNIEYNTFIGVNKYFDINKYNLINFDKNLYLDLNHSPLPSPNGDVIIYNSEEELKDAYVNKGSVKYYKVIFHPGDGQGLPKSTTTLDEFAYEIVADFLAAGTAVTTREEFQRTSHPNIRNLFNNPEMLEKYKWFFEFIKGEMLSVSEENPDVLTDNSFGINLYQTTLDLLNGLIDGDITAIDKNAYARTALRQYIHKIININNPNASSGINAYDFIIPSYEDSDVERFEEVLQRVSRLYYSSNDELPVLTLDGYEFEGWFDGEGENANLVTNITCDCHLYARFKEIKYY